MQTRQATWGIAGDGRMTERKFGLWFYRRSTRQRWTPLMHEIKREWGIRIGPWRFGFSKTFKHFLNGQRPEIVPGGYI